MEWPGSGSGRRRPKPATRQTAIALRQGGGLIMGLTLVRSAWPPSPT